MHRQPMLSSVVKLAGTEIFADFIDLKKNSFGKFGLINLVLWAGNHFVGSETPKHNAFNLTDQYFEKSKFNLKQFPRNTQFLNFEGLRNYLYLFWKQPI